MEAAARFDIHYIPFENRYLIYRPLIRLAFVANGAMVAYVQSRIAGAEPSNGEVDRLLDAMDFWQPDPEISAEDPRDQPHLPTVAVLLMTTRCNLRCTYCYADAGETPVREMTVDLAHTVIDAACSNALELGIARFGLTFHGGGEPVLNWDVMLAAGEYAMARELPCELSMSSNGVWTDAQREWIIENMTDVSLSFDGIREVHDAQRPRAGGVGSFEAVMKSIRAMDEADFRYGIRMTVTPPFFDTIPDSVAFLCDATSSAPIQIEPTYGTERGGHQEPTPEEADGFVRGFLRGFEVAARAGRHFYYSGARPWAITPVFCTAPYRALVATPDGDLMVCYEATDRNHPMSDRLRIGSVSPNGGVQIDRRRLAAEYEAQRRRRIDCRGCFCYYHCGGDCTTRCGDRQPGTGGGRCTVNRAITRDIIAWYVAAGEGIWHQAIDAAARRPCAVCR